MCSIDLGNFIRTSRKEKGLTQVELASLCNISQSFIADLEVNKIVTVSWINLLKIHIVLDIKTDIFKLYELVYSQKTLEKVMADFQILSKFIKDDKFIPNKIEIFNKTRELQDLELEVQDVKKSLKSAKALNTLIENYKSLNSKNKKEIVSYMEYLKFKNGDQE